MVHVPPSWHESGFAFPGSQSPNSFPSGSCLWHQQIQYIISISTIRKAFINCKTKTSQPIGLKSCLCKRKHVPPSMYKRSLAFMLFEVTRNVTVGPVVALEAEPVRSCQCLSGSALPPSLEAIGSAVLYTVHGSCCTTMRPLALNYPFATDRIDFRQGQPVKQCLHIRHDSHERMSFNDTLVLTDHLSGILCANSEDVPFETSLISPILTQPANSQADEHRQRTSKQ